MKISENQILKSKRNGFFKILKIKGPRYILIEFLDSHFKYLVDESNILRNSLIDYKQEELDFLKKEYIQKSGDILFVLNKERGNLYNCIFKESLNTGCYPKYKIINGEIKDFVKNKKELNRLKKSEELSNLYSKWKCLQNRCLNKQDKSFKNYGEIGITFCDEWLNFENFKNWYFQNKYEDNLSIDKDVLYNVNHLKQKIYSPETCILLPTNLNCWFASDCKKVGVTLLENNRYKAKIGGKYLGTFDTFDEAKNIYAKEKYKQFLVELEKYNIPNDIKEILLKYDFSWWWQ